MYAREEPYSQAYSYQFLRGSVEEEFVNSEYCSQKRDRGRRDSGAARPKRYILHLTPSLTLTPEQARAQTQHYSGRELKGFEMRACMLVIHAPSLDAAPPSRNPATTSHDEIAYKNRSATTTSQARLL